MYEGELPTDNPGAQVRVKLMTENSLGCHLINLFNETLNLCFKQGIVPWMLQKLMLTVE